jgi:hypothetical protein
MCGLGPGVQGWNVDACQHLGRARQRLLSGAALAAEPAESGSPVMHLRSSVLCAHTVEKVMHEAICASGILNWSVIW